MYRPVSSGFAASTPNAVDAERKSSTLHDKDAGKGYLLKYAGNDLVFYMQVEYTPRWWGFTRELSRWKVLPESSVFGTSSVQRRVFDLVTLRFTLIIILIELKEFSNDVFYELRPPACRNLVLPLDC
jgi:hypothetical protein